jgi:phosphate transport system substrate-binding protein
MLHRILAFFILISALPAAAQQVRIGGNGTFTAFMAAMAERYRQIDPGGGEIRVVLPPLGSSGGLKALSSGDLDIAGGIRPLTPKEREMPNIGEERRLGATPFVLITSNLTAGPFSLTELAAVYAGKTRFWPDGSPIRLILRARIEGVTAFMRNLSPELSAGLDAAYDRKGMVIADNDLDTSALAEKTPGSLAPSSLLLTRIEKRALTPLPFGVSGGAGAELGVWITLPERVSPQTARFVNFLTSKAGRDYMVELGLTPNAP